LLAARDFERARELGVHALRDYPEDASLLRLVGQANLELGNPEAVEFLKRAAEADPDQPEVWQEVGDALIAGGEVTGARAAFRRAAALQPDAVGVHVDLAHAAYADGDVEEAISELEGVLERDPANGGVLRSLVGISRAAGRTRDAHAAATRLAEVEPDDPDALLQLAELSLELGRVDQAVEVYRHLRTVDEDQHQIYAYHGMIEAELTREGWRRALDFAIEATRVDRLGRTTDILAYIVARVFGAGERSAPSRTEVDAALAASQAEHRREHEEALVL
jgi:tetratricopeptide (TPR) repeat protein